MRSIVVSMQNMLLSEAVARTLAETGEFRVEQVLPGKTSDTFSLCRVMQADILLMEVSRLPAYTLENRLNLIACVRKVMPSCKFVLLCDENVDPELAHRVMIVRCFPLCFRYPRLSDCRAGCAVRKERPP